MAGEVQQLSDKVLARICDGCLLEDISSLLELESVNDGCASA